MARLISEASWEAARFCPRAGECWIATASELKTATGASPGATIRALAGLTKARLILQGTSGPRGRTDHKITADGRRYLKQGWRDRIDHGPSGDLDTDLRVALLALFIGEDRGLAADFVRRSASQRLESAHTVRESNRSAELPLALWYKSSVRLRRMPPLRANPPRRSRWQRLCRGVHPSGKAG